MQAKSRERVARDRKPPFYRSTVPPVHGITAQPDFLTITAQEAENETGVKEIRRKKEFIVVVSDTVRYALTTNNHIASVGYPYE